MVPSVIIKLLKKITVRSSVKANESRLADN